MPPVGYRDQVIKGMPGTFGEIAEKSGMQPSTVQRWVRILRDEGQCHITGWKRSEGRGPIKPIYAHGPGADAKCTLKRRTGAEYSRRHRRLTKGTEIGDRRREKEAARYFARKAARQGDPLINALFGRTQS